MDRWHDDWVRHAHVRLVDSGVHLLSDVLELISKDLEELMRSIRRQPSRFGSPHPSCIVCPCEPPDDDEMMTRVMTFSSDDLTSW